MRRKDEPPTSVGSTALAERLPQRWIELVGETLFEFTGDPSSQATRRVVAIRSLAPLVKRQKTAGIPAAYRTAMLATAEERNPGQLDVVRSYLTAPDHSLYVYGHVGVGKTWIACCIGNDLLARGKTVRFQPLSGLLLDLRHTFSTEGQSERDVLRPFVEAEYLLLDEVGDIALEREPRASGFAASRLLTLLEERWREAKPTIMTSNQSVKRLVEWAGDERIGSRIVGMCGQAGVVELSGRDLRFG